MRIRPDRARLVGVALALLVGLGCGAVESSTKPGDDAGRAALGATGEGDGGACGLVLFRDAYAPNCQKALDTACCDAERACDAEAGCLAFVRCVNQCALPHKPSCLSWCDSALLDDPAAQGALSDLTSCSDTLPVVTGPSPPGCTWRN